ncbi:MmgE/PrpD family protein [Prauserella sp. PE36]|uniref:MmgE/PrpD family protein n=1 Tax=Prauserella sp. PE36 TaxID=1504709 RepID=UPI000D9A40B9|nr:MmgE/PrpD family protein [Prauserella sp. PE36]PXY23211.1 MmgE/PrpD family protein [Prauserella coralliicola]RBM18804.1 MmgE/PrpD family protein [Prauserella sp. PE36]
MTTDPTDPQGVTGRLATWIAELRYDDIPEVVRERARHLLLDGLVCALVGARLPWSERAVGAVLGLEGAGDVPVLGWGLTTSASAACLLNGTFIQGFELDDYHVRAPLHSNSLVVPSAVSTLTTLGRKASGRQLLTALVAGYEVGPRVGLALHGAEMLSRGWHSGAVFGTHASAATSAWLRRLDAARIEDALGLAATQSAGLMAAQYEAMSKRMHHGFSSRNGLYAAALAEAGYTGIKRVYEREYGGFLATFGEGHSPRADLITDGLGQEWVLMDTGVKAYAAMAATHASIDCALEARARGISADDIRSISVEVSHAAYHHGWWQPEPPLETIGAQMNIGYAVSVALLDGRVLAEQFTRDRISADDVWALLRRIEVHHRADFDRPDDRFRTRMRLTLHSGDTVEIEVDGPLGGPTRPLPNRDVVAKARRLAESIDIAERWQRIEHLVLNLESLPDASVLVDDLAASVPALPVTL